MLCRPEDTMCTSLVHHEPLDCCENCEAPVGKECAAQVFQQKPEIPPAALSKDMMVDVAPEELVEHDVTGHG